MKKQMEEQPKRVMPAFATEAEEAEWGYKNRNIHGKRMLAAVKNGEAQVLTKEKLWERIAASKKTTAPRGGSCVTGLRSTIAGRPARLRGPGRGGAPDKSRPTSAPSKNPRPW